MSHTALGITTGAVLALTWIAFGFWAFVFVAFAMTIGVLIARVVDGKLDLRNLAQAFRGKRTSS